MVSGYLHFVRLVSRSREYDLVFLSLQVTIITMTVPVPVPSALCYHCGHGGQGWSSIWPLDRKYFLTQVNGCHLSMSFVCI